MLIMMTPKKLINYMKDYDYELTLEQAQETLDLCNDYFDNFTSDELQMATDYIVNNENSIFAKYF